MSAAFVRRAQPFVDAGVLAHEDVYAVSLVAPRFGERDLERMLALAFAVRAPRTGAAGVCLGQVRARVGDELALRGARASAPTDDAAGTDEADEPLAPLPWPDDAKGWEAAALGSPMVSADGREGDRPFVAQRLADGSTLLLTLRLHDEQRRVAASLRARAADPFADGALPPDLDARVRALFRDPEGDDRESFAAALLAARHRLAVVTGGPGTGKTFLVTRLLAALLAHEPADRPLTIALAAPTGKAAVRMLEAIREALGSLAASDAVKARLASLRATTLHRLVGARPDGSVRHGATNPIAVDVVVVDEVSMVDLAMMRRLVEAVPLHARLVLLGDRDQLASVEAGCVLADLVRDALDATSVSGGALDARPGSGGALDASVAQLTRSRRFASAPDVALIASCLQGTSDARTGEAVEVLVGERHAANETAGGSRVVALGGPDRPAGGGRARPSPAQLDALARPYVEGTVVLGGAEAGTQHAGYAGLLCAHVTARGRWAASLRERALQRSLLDALDRYRVLAVHRAGPLGVEGLEAALAERVRAALLPTRGDRATGARLASRGAHWLGRPVLVTENAYDVGLMNGDVGLVLPHPTVDDLFAAFPSVDGSGGVRHVPLSRLPPHEGALAMTVHKAQGSQYDRVALVLAGRESPIQTRELVYTAVTRAKDQLTWLGDRAELELALGRRVTRASGLAELLR